jgi:hypothetical protein
MANQGIAVGFPEEARYFYLLSKAFSTATVPSQLPDAYFSGVWWPSHESDYYCPCSATVRNEWNYAAQLHTPSRLVQGQIYLDHTHR